MSIFPRKGVRNKDGSRKQGDSDRTARPSRDSEAERGAARQTGTTYSYAYLRALHRQMASDAFSRIIGAPLASVLSCLMIGVSFALPALLYLLVANLQLLGHGWDGQPRVSLFLSADLGRSSVEKLRAEVYNDPDVENIFYISPDEGLSDFQQRADMNGVIEALGFNPLPGVIEIQPAAGLSYEQLDQLAARYQNKPGVSEARLDREWVQRLQAIIGLLENLALFLSGLLGITVLLTVGNTVRLGIESRKSEIRVVKLVGGTDGYIMLPFLYMGMWYGLGGALLSLLVVWLVLAGVMSSVLELANLYGSNFSPTGPGLNMTLSLLLSGAVLGVTGAAASCYRHLRAVESH